MELTHGSVFAGFGGLDLGFERAGFKPIWCVEINNYARQVLDQHWPAIPKFRDITTCGRHNLVVPTVITGGFPCQDVSYVGTGKGLTGERSGLWYEMLRVVSELRPHFLVVENTAALLFRGMGCVLGGLSEIGYDAEWEVLSAEAFGAPHERERTFIVAYPTHLSGLQTCPRLVSDRSQALAWHDNHQLRWAEMASTDWKIPESYTIGAIDGIPRRVDRAKALGNAVVPQIAEAIGKMIRSVEQFYGQP